MSASTRLSILLLGGLGLLAGMPWPAVAHLSSRPPLVLRQSARECKPLAPLKVALVAGVAAAGERVALGASIEPLLEFDRVEYALLLPDGSRLLDGSLSGPADPGRGRVTAADALLHLPADTGPFGELRLLVRGTFTDGSGTSREVEVERSLAWGERPAPVPVRTHAGAPGRDEVSVHALPTTHRRGS